jgi:hypothetical protein
MVVVMMEILKFYGRWRKKLGAEGGKFIMTGRGAGRWVSFTNGGSYVTDKLFMRKRIPLRRR